jgi:hypothetical protein
MLLRHSRVPKRLVAEVMEDRILHSADVAPLQQHAPLRVEQEDRKGPVQQAFLMDGKLASGADGAIGLVDEDQDVLAWLRQLGWQRACVRAFSPQCHRGHGSIPGAILVNLRSAHPRCRRAWQQVTGASTSTITRFATTGNVVVSAMPPKAARPYQPRPSQPSAGMPGRLIRCA